MKDNTNKYVMIGFGIIVLGYFLNKYLKSIPKTIESGAYDGLDLDKTLAKGDTGDEVAKLQYILVNTFDADLGFTGVDKDGVDGQFGAMTEIALLKAKGVKKISLKKLLTSIQNEK
jgi:hypothetical protein